MYFIKAAGSEGIKNDSIMLSDIWQCAGASYFYKGSIDSAIICFSKSIEILKTGKYPLKYGIALCNLGQVYSGKHDHSAALAHLKSASDQFISSGDSTFFAFALAETGNTLSEMMQFGPAETYLSTAIRIAGNLEEKTVLGKAYLYFSNLYANDRDYKKAFHYLNEYNKVRESLLADDVFNYLQFYETTWQNEIGREITKKEGEALKRSETTVELNKTRLYLALLGLIIIIVIFTATYTYRLYRLKRRANIYLTELNRSKEKFLSIISHDVRGPIVGFIDLLEPLNRQIKDLSPGQISGHIDKIISMSQNIKLLVDNLLEWTKAQQGLIECNREPFSLSEAVAPDLDIYRQIAGSKGIRLVNNLKPETGIFADRNMIRVIVRNLLNNAVKFSGKEDVITINASPDGDHIVVSVEDTGIGMEPGFISGLFDGAKDSSEIASGRKNSGLGLLLCREYVEKCNGKIWVKSDGVNTGSAFFFTVKTSQESWIKSN
jgi:signal transduction histidine kinase